MRSLFLIASPLILAAACLGGGDGGPTPTPTPRPTLPPYSGIKFCVDAIDLSDEFEQFALQRVIETGERGPNGEMPQAGCPRPLRYPPALEARTVQSSEGEGTPFGAFVYVFADSEIPPSTDFTSEEDVCSGDFCWAVTQGVYLKASQLCDPELLRAAIQATFGRAREYPNIGPTPYFDAPLPPGLTPTPSPTPCY